MKERELVKLGACAVCGEHLLEDAFPLFYRVQITRMGFDAAATRRAMGLAMQIGGPLASVMGPDEDLANPVDGPSDCVVHERCADKITHLFELMKPHA
jgi:hypothetical protein